MHTTEWEIPGYGKVTVNTNGDLSGEAIIFYTVLGEKKEVRIPAMLLVELSKRSAFHRLRMAIVRFLEQEDC